MRWRTVLLLLVVAGLLVAYLLMKGRLPGPPPTTTERALKGYGFYQAREIVIWPKPKGQAPAIKIVRGPQGYRVREPVRDRASSAWMRNLREIFDHARLLEGYDARTLEAQPDLVAQCGLLEPARTIRLRFEADGTEGTDGAEFITLEMGGDAPLGNGIYVRRDDTIYRCPNSAPRSVLNVQPDDVRERVLVDPLVMATLEVCRVTRRQGDKVSELELTKNHLGEFRITSPGNMRADQSVVAGYLAALQGLRIRSFLPGGVDKKIGPAVEPVYHIVLASPRGTETIRIFRVPGAARLWGHHGRRNIAFEITPKDGLAALDVEADQLRARVLLPIRREDIVRILLEPGDGGPRTDLRLGMGQTFRMHAPIIGHVEPTPLSNLLQGLTTMQVWEFLDDADPGALGLGPEALRVSVQENRTRQTITLRIGRESEDGRFTYVMREDEDYVAKVPAANADKVRQRWVDLLDLTVTDLKLPPFRLEVLRDGKPRFVYRQVVGSHEWRADGSEEADPRIRELVEDHLLELQARRALEQPDEVGPPLVLRLYRDRQGGDVLLELRAWLHEGVVLVGRELSRNPQQGPQPPRVVYQVNNSLLEELLERWSK